MFNLDVVLQLSIQFFCFLNADYVFYFYLCFFSCDAPFILISNYSDKLIHLNISVSPHFILQIIPYWLILSSPTHFYFYILLYKGSNFQQYLSQDYLIPMQYYYFLRFLTFM